MLNSNAFLQIFSDIESWLRRQNGAERSTTYSELVERTARRNSAVRRYQSDLKEFADLRNAIVHERSDGHVIAEPNDRAVADFQRVRDALLAPKTVFPKFQMQVQALDAADSIAIAVTTMRNGAFSQIPIISDGRVTALLTTETVVRWLAAEASADVLILSETAIEKVLPHVDDPDHFRFLSRTATLLDALDLFEDFASRGKDLDAILISNDGKPGQALLGILTVYDLPALLAELGLQRVSTV